MSWSGQGGFERRGYHHGNLREALIEAALALIAEKGPATIRGLLNLCARKLDLVAEYEDRVPAYVEQMFDRLEASGIILGWDRNDWDITTTRVGLDIRIGPKAKGPKAKEWERRSPIIGPPIP